MVVGGVEEAGAGDDGEEAAVDLDIGDGGISGEQLARISGFAILGPISPVLDINQLKVARPKARGHSLLLGLPNRPPRSLGAVPVNPLDRRLARKRQRRIARAGLEEVLLDVLVYQDEIGCVRRHAAEAEARGRDGLGSGVEVGGAVDDGDGAVLVRGPQLRRQAVGAGDARLVDEDGRGEDLGVGDCVCDAEDVLVQRLGEDLAERSVEVQEALLQLRNQLASELQ